MEFAGGESICATDLARLGSMRHPWPLCHMRPLALGAPFLRWCKQWTLQFVVVKPIMAVISTMMLASDLYFSDGYQWTLSIIYNICYTVALVCIHLVVIHCVLLAGSYADMIVWVGLFLFGYAYIGR